MSQTRVTRLAAALTGFGFTAVAAWTLSAGLISPPAEVFSRSQNVEFSLPYRGVCQGLSLSSGDEAISLTSYDVRSGLARFSFPLAPGRHELLVHFDTLVPGLQRSYPLAVVVDQTPPQLTLAKNALLATPGGATIAETVRVEGVVEPGTRLLVGDKELAVDGNGAFLQDLALEEGWNNWLLSAEDRAGNRTSKKIAIFRDTRAPDITWRTAPGHVFKEPTARLEISIDDDGPLAGVTSKVDGKPIAWHRKSADRWLGMTEKLCEGRHTVELKVADRAGRVSTSRREIMIDSSETLGEAELALGARGEDVVLLHQRLIDAGYMIVSPGSVFTAATKSALETFQADEGFLVTGRADGETLIALGPRVIVNLSQFSLVLERPGQPDRRWSIACGAPEFPTPTGRFFIYEKVVEPTWLPPNSEWAKDAKQVEPGPDNPLGTRWIGLDWGGIGFHGTNAPWTVGTAASHGCMRMESSQVEEFFSLVEVGTPVVILGGWEDDSLLKKYWP